MRYYYWEILLRSPCSRSMLLLPVAIGRRHRCKGTVRASNQGRLYNSNFPFCSSFCKVSWFVLFWFLWRVIVKRVTRVDRFGFVTIIKPSNMFRSWFCQCVNGNRNVFWHSRNKCIFLFENLKIPFSIPQVWRMKRPLKLSLPEFLPNILLA